MFSKSEFNYISGKTSPSRQYKRVLNHRMRNKIGVPRVRTSNNSKHC